MSLVYILCLDLWLNTPTVPINGSTDTHNLYYYLVVSIFKFSFIITEQDGQRILEKLLKVRLGTIQHYR